MASEAERQHGRAAERVGERGGGRIHNICILVPAGAESGRLWTLIKVGVRGGGPLIPSYSIKGMRIITTSVLVDDVTRWISG